MQHSEHVEAEIDRKMMERVESHMAMESTQALIVHVRKHFPSLSEVLRVTFESGYKHGMEDLTKIVDRLQGVEDA